MSVNEPPRPAATYARATLEYDNEHERELIEAITRTIFETSVVSDVNAVVIRTHETAKALLTELAGRPRNVASGGTLTRDNPTPNDALDIEALWQDQAPRILAPAALDDEVT